METQEPKLTTEKLLDELDELRDGEARARRAFAAFARRFDPAWLMLAAAALSALCIGLAVALALG